MDQKRRKGNRVPILRHQLRRRQDDLRIPLVRTRKPRDQLDKTRIVRRTRYSLNRRVQIQKKTTPKYPNNGGLHPSPPKKKKTTPKKNTPHNKTFLSKTP